MTRARRAVWVSTSTATKGGVASYVRTMQGTPLWSRWSVRHVATHQDGSVAKRVVRFARGGVTFWLYLLFWRPDVVHLHSASRGSFARKSIFAWSAWALRVPVVLHVHGGGFADFHDGSPALVRRYIRATLEAVGAVVALGPSWADRLQCIAPSARVVVMPNAISPMSTATPAPSEGEPVVVLFLGQVTAAKGVFVLVRAWAKLLETQPAAVRPRLVIAGDGELDDLRLLLHHRGVEDSVDLLGWVSVDRVEALLLSSHVLVLPSRWEGHPMAVLEAMAHGLAIVATGVGGLPDLVDETSGVLVEPDDVEGLTRALAQVVFDPPERARLGDAGLARVREEFDVAVTWRAIENLYERLAHG